ncbi:MAG: hypothetical protein ACI8ZB_003967 [Desulforhopalus sp.]|jgi:hypothetical protein
MKLLRYFFAGLACVILTNQASLAVMQDKGTNGKVEWGVVRELQLPSSPIDIAHSLDGNFAFVLTKESEVLVYDKKGGLQGTIPVNKGVTSITLDPYGKFLHMSDSENNIFYTLSIDFVVKINDVDAPYKGKKDAPITIADFSDFQ